MLRAITMVLFAIFVPLLTLAIARPRLMATEGTEAMQMVDPGDCTQPCWQGIQPGKTTLHSREPSGRLGTRVLDIASIADAPPPLRMRSKVE